jgi:hypothetical protein
MEGDMPHPIRPFQGLALIGFFLDERTAAAFVSGTLVTRIGGPIGFRQVWRRYRRAVEAAVPWGTVDLPAVTSPDPTLTPYLATVQANPMFISLYSAATWRFVSIEIGKLIAFQPHVEIERYERTPGPVGLGTEQQRAEFCLPADPMEPMNQVIEQDATGTVTAVNFSSSRRTLLFSGFGPDPGGWRWAILGRPNHVVVCEYAGRYYLRNGYHRLVALQRMGFINATVILQTVGTWAEVAPPGLFPDAIMLAAPRPPMLRDFNDPAFAYRCRVRPEMNVLRVAYTEQRIPLV